jgi:hypothetical protein
MDLLHQTPARARENPGKSPHVQECEDERFRAETHMDGGKRQTRTASREVAHELANPLSISTPVDLLLPPTPRRVREKRPGTEIKETYKHVTTPRHSGSSATTPRDAATTPREAATTPREAATRARLPATSPRRPVTGETFRGREFLWSRASSGGGGGWFGANSIGTLRTGLRPCVCVCVCVCYTYTCICTLTHRHSAHRETCGKCQKRPIIAAKEIY